MPRYTIEQGPITVNYGIDQANGVFLSVSDSRLVHNTSASEAVNAITEKIGIKDGGGSYFDLHTGKNGFGLRVNNKTMATYLRRYGVEDETFLALLESPLKGTKNLCAVCQIPATMKCSSCASISYCSKDCQKQHWKLHKVHCPLLKNAGLISEWGKEKYVLLCYVNVIVY